MGDIKANGVIGLDIGGANLKAVHSDGCVRCEPFALWERPSELPAALLRAFLVAGLAALVLQQFPVAAADRFDCFPGIACSPFSAAEERVFAQLPLIFPQ